MPSNRSSLLNKAKNIRLIAMDVDGVLTGGEIIVLQSGQEIKVWNAKDRLLIAQIHRCRLPIVFAWITGRASKAVKSAAKDLGVKHVVQNCLNKKKAIQEIVRREKVTYGQVAFIGDDLIDLPVLTRVGFSACPVDAANDIRERVDYISPYAGGRGAVRDVVEFILKAKNQWDAILKPFLS